MLELEVKDTNVALIDVNRLVNQVKVLLSQLTTCRRRKALALNGPCTLLSIQPKRLSHIDALARNLTIHSGLGFVASISFLVLIEPP
jgi:hypothetical protein